MPCNSDYMAPNHKQRRLQETAKLLCYAITCMGNTPDQEMRRAANNIYCTADYVPDLCSLIGNMSEEQLNRIVYDGRNSEARKLADWWEKHQEADMRRLEKEYNDHKREELRKSAISKLTDEELAALGVK